MIAAGGYAGSVVAFATAHGKELLARAPFASILSAQVIAPAGLDTDQFGTFSGEIPRTLTPHAAARAKTTLAMNTTDASLALASEGSFSSEFGLLVEHHELLMFTDRDRDLELTESVIRLSALLPRRRITSVEDAAGYATTLGFPAQGVILQAGDRTHKALHTRDDLDRTIRSELAAGDPVYCEPDLRSHMCPSRAKVIAELATTMAHRLATPCPACNTPGFGRVNVERGLPCRDCGCATDTIAADLLGCGSCAYRERITGNVRFAEPARCPVCNP